MAGIQIFEKLGTYGVGAAAATQLGAKGKTAATSSAKAADTGKEPQVAQAAQDVASLGSSATSVAGGGAHAIEFAAAKGLLKFGGKTAARFTPGLNVAAAGFDSAEAAARWANPKVSVSKALSQSVVAAGSVAAATNVPIVSQVGAGVSAVASLVDMVL